MLSFHLVKKKETPAFPDNGSHSIIPLFALWIIRTHRDRLTGVICSHTQTHLTCIISHRVQSKLSWDKPSSAFISQKSNAHPYSKLLLINSEHQNWTTLNASKSKVNHALRVSSCESIPTDSHVKMSFTAKVNVFTGWTHSWVTVCLPDRSWRTSSTCTHFAYFCVNQALSSIRHWHDGDVGTASSELWTAPQKPMGGVTSIFIYNLWIVSAALIYASTYVTLVFFQLNSTQVKLVRKART